MKSVFLRVLCGMVALVLLLPAGISKAEPYDVRDPQSCKLNFAVLSDVHVEGNNFSRYKIYSQTLQNLKKNQSGHDAIIFLGDSTMNGQSIENILFHGAASIWLRNETVLPALGNHDIGNGEGDYEKLQNRWYAYTEAFFGKKLSHPYYYEVIDGCYFIVLGMQTQDVHDFYLSEAQYAWLEDVLEQAGKSGKPTFIFSHHPVDYAIDDEGNETDRLVNILADFNKEHDLFSFVGHTHMPMYLFWSFHTDDGFPETYLPQLTMLSGNDDEPAEDCGVGVEVEVYENEVQIRARDFYRGEWKYDTYDEAMCEVTYPLKHAVS